jgi:regulator of sigma E protease
MFSITSALLLAFGFGFVIFFHELGHFLAAKWAGVKVEQFAVGFGQALFSWRKGLGFRWGSTQAEYLRRLEDYLDDNRLAPRHISAGTNPQPAAAAAAAADSEAPAGAGTFGDLPLDRTASDPTAARLSYASAALGISETEYRLNWIPLGGYVKMLGQDDLKPGVTVEDPRAYNNKPISKRMVIVSAGVIMNVILAFVGFMFIFWVGIKVPPAIVGAVEPGSPAQRAYKMVDGHKVIVGLQPGDRILYLNNKYQYDFEKIGLNTALLPPGPIPLYVQHRDGTDDHLTVLPAKPPEEGDFFRMGVTPAFVLQGIDANDVKQADLAELNAPDLSLPEARLVQPGDTITAIAGQPVEPNQFWKLDEATQRFGGQPVPITIRSASGQIRTGMLVPHFIDRFDGDPPQFAGMLMRPVVQSILPKSKARGVLEPGDVIAAFSADTQHPPANAPCTREGLMTALNEAGQRGGSVSITVLRDGKYLQLAVKPTMRVSPERYGLGIALGSDERHAVVAGTVDDSPAARAGILPGSRLTGVNGHPVSNWFDVHAVLATLGPQDKLMVTAEVDGKPTTFSLGTLSPEEIASVASDRLGEDLELRADLETRKTTNILTAAEWGVGETRDAILQVYQTFRAMASRSISVKQVSSFVGIAAAGYKFAEMGIVRLVWFLSIISANLAVMNFLPIPIVDGGLFTFLIIEKLKGSPVSQRVQAIAQVVGLAILLSVFLFATYQDVFYRLPFLSR